MDCEDSGTAISGCSSQALSSDVATCAVTYSVTGTHSITATYSGDSNFAGSTSSALTVTVGLGQTSVSITEALGLSTPLPASGYASTPFVGPASSR